VSFQIKYDADDDDDATVLAVVFAIGSRWYTRIQPGDNILGRFYGCIWVCIVFFK